MSEVNTNEYFGITVCDLEIPKPEKKPRKKREPKKYVIPKTKYFVPIKRKK